MSENKRYRVFKYIDYDGYGASDDIAEYTLATFDNHIEAEVHCDRLNEQDEQIKELEIELQNKTEKWKYELGMKLKYHSKLIDSEKGNNDLKDFIRKISTNNKIILANGTIYKIDKVIK